jgi:hypothetical protein
MVRAVDGRASSNGERPSQIRITGFLDFLHRPVFQRLENTTFRKLDLFPSSGVGGGKTPTQLGLLDRANLNHWTYPVRFTTAI